MFLAGQSTMQVNIGILEHLLGVPAPSISTAQIHGEVSARGRESRSFAQGLRPRFPLVSIYQGPAFGSSQQPCEVVTLSAALSALEKRLRWAEAQAASGPAMLVIGPGGSVSFCLGRVPFNINYLSHGQLCCACTQQSTRAQSRSATARTDIIFVFVFFEARLPNCPELILDA